MNWTGSIGYTLWLLTSLLTCTNASAQVTGPDSLYRIQDSVFIPIRDGHVISSILVRNKENTQPLPVILFFTTYDQGRRDAYFGKLSVDRGYVGIVAYARGIRTQIDDFFPYENCGRDAYDVIDWISRQPWCDGRVAMFGGSYTGFVQWSTLKHVHPALKTVVPQVAVMPGFDTPMENNIPQGFTLSWPSSILKYPRLPWELNDTWYEKGTSYRKLDSLAGQPNRIFQKWLRHPGYDDYWKSTVPTPKEYANINIPILCTTGYYDGAQIGALQYIRLYCQHNPKPNLYLVIGPYDHWGAQRGSPADTLMDYPIDAVARQSMRGLAFDWFDYILKGKEKPAILADRFNYEVMGANEWKHAPSLAAMSNDTMTLYLTDVQTGDRYALAREKPARRTFLSQTVDFQDRTDQNNYYTRFIINDSLDASNGLVFTTEAVTQEFDLAGCFSGSLVASINKKDMDVSIAFYEQLPDGKYFYLTRYLGRASYAHDNAQRTLLRPGHEETIPLNETRMVCKRIGKGSRLVIILNVNKHPYEEINYGTGKDVHDETIADALEPLQIQWASDSFIRIPIWKPAP